MGGNGGRMRLAQIRRVLAVIEEPRAAEPTVPDESRPFAVTPEMRKRWLASETLRTPEPGSHDVVQLKRKRR